MRRKDLLTVLGIALVMIGAISLAGYDLFLSRATPSFEGKRSVKIAPGKDFEETTQLLVEAEILEKQRGFRWLGSWTGWSDQIKAGHYEFESGLSNVEIMDRLRRGLQSPVRVTIPAGTRKERVIRTMAREMAFSEEELAAVMSNEALAAELETDTTHLWAYMLPETYFFYWLTGAEEVVRRVKKEADAVMAMAGDEGEFDVSLSADEAIRMAGIVEWETAHEPEKAIISGVYHNRLRSRWALQADPTVQFAVMELEGEKRRLLFKDYEIPHAYNTYLYRGLPPGPLTNPSASSIRAAMRPESHRYYYFVATGDGSHIFSRTLAEHRRNAQEYYRVMRERRAAAAAEADEISTGS